MILFKKGHKNVEVNTYKQEKLTTKEEVQTRKNILWQAFPVVCLGAASTHRKLQIMNISIFTLFA